MWVMIECCDISMGSWRWKCRNRPACHTVELLSCRTVWNSGINASITLKICQNVLPNNFIDLHVVWNYHGVSGHFHKKKFSKHEGNGVYNEETMHICNRNTGLNEMHKPIDVAIL